MSKTLKSILFASTIIGSLDQIPLNGAVPAPYGAHLEQKRLSHEEERQYDEIVKTTLYGLGISAGLFSLGAIYAFSMAQSHQKEDD